MKRSLEDIDTDNMMNFEEIAQYLGVKRHTVTAYYYRGQMPKEDLRVRQCRLWKIETIEAWNSTREKRKGKL